MLSFNLARSLAQRLRMMNERLVADTLPDPLRKVAQTLTVLAPKGKPLADTAQILLPPLSLHDWSLFCYTTPEVFRASLDMLRRVGVVDLYNHQVVITDLPGLAKLAKVETESGEKDALL